MKEQIFTFPKGLRSFARLMGFLTAFPMDKAIKVTVVEARSTRSLEQNAYLWGVVYPTVLQHLPGWDANDLHEYFLGEWSGWQTLEGFGRKRLKPIRRSSKLSTSEFIDFVDFIQRTMAEKGVVIPDPNEEVSRAA